MIIVGQKLGKLEVVGLTAKSGVQCVCQCGATKTFPKRFTKRLLSGAISSCGCDLTRLGYRFRIYPNEAQKHELAVQFGQARFVYNHFLTLRKEAWFQHNLTLSKEEMQVILKELKQTEPYGWLNQGDSQVLQGVLDQLDTAYQNFFRMKREGTLPPSNGKPRKDGMPKGFPHYHSKHDEQSITYPQRFKVTGSRIYLPKVGWVRAVFHRPMEGEMKNCVVTRTKSSKYFISIQCEVKRPEPEFGDKPPVGIDVGLRRFATLSRPLPDGRTVIEHPQYFRKAEEKLKRLQRCLSRRQKGSRNRDKARLALVRQHEKVANQRQDFLHKQSRQVVDAFGYIGLETLNITGMIRNPRLAKSIADSGWGMFARFITYKGRWYGSYVERFEMFYPSSRLCSTPGCGYIHRDLKQGQTSWVCPDCGKWHDRDDNAAENLEPTVGATGRAIVMMATPVREGKLQGESLVPFVEAGSPPPYRRG
ncbi:MAG: transposase [Anaerolineae bacterium]|nr:transposase [Anaerolineae bacterium]